MSPTDRLIVENSASMAANEKETNRILESPVIEEDSNDLNEIVMSSSEVEEEKVV
jgi:hypothetical protein